MIIRWAGILGAVLAGWVGVLAGVMVLSDAAPAAVVLFPSADFLRGLPGDVEIVSQSAVSITISSAVPGFGLSLYSSGALLVLPAGLLGCLPAPSA